MFETSHHNISRAWYLPRPVGVFTVTALGLLVAVGALASAIFGNLALPIVLFSLISALSLRGLMLCYPHDVLGACNVVTLVRMASIAVLAGAIFAPAASWAVFFIAIAAFASDGVDGWLARRAGLVSAFGARFDMEADALLGAVLAFVLLTHGTVGPAILVLGFSRYVFVAAGLGWPALQCALPESFRRKTICVVQIAALIALVCPLTPIQVLPWIANGTAVLLLYSFAVDTRTLMRRTV